MNLSRGEYRSLVAKAFRGASYPWGLTEDAGFAAVRAAELGLGSPNMVVRLLETVDGRPTSSLMPSRPGASHANASCPVCLGAALVDARFDERLEVEVIAAPLLVVPFLHEIVRTDGASGFRVGWAEGEAVVDPAGAVVSGQSPTGPTVVRIVPDASVSGLTKRCTRVEVDANTIASLEWFARRTFAPATESGRVSGAGAGTHDND
jgi:hypothetical protein